MFTINGWWSRLYIVALSPTSYYIQVLMKSRLSYDNYREAEILYFPRLCLNLRSDLEIAENGCLPVNSSNTVTPRDHISALWLYGSFMSISGAIYASVPKNSFSDSSYYKLLANPKSPILILKSILGIKSGWLL